MWSVKYKIKACRWLRNGSWDSNEVFPLSKAKCATLDPILTFAFIHKQEIAHEGMVNHPVPRYGVEETLERLSDISTLVQLNYRIVIVHFCQRPPEEIEFSAPILSQRNIFWVVLASRWISRLWATQSISSCPATISLAFQITQLGIFLKYDRHA